MYIYIYICIIAISACGMFELSKVMRFARILRFIRMAPSAQFASEQ